MGMSKTQNFYFGLFEELQTDFLKVIMLKMSLGSPMDSVAHAESKRGALCLIPLNMKCVVSTCQEETRTARRV